MNACRKVATVTVLVIAAGACETVNPPPASLRSSEEIAKRIEAVAEEDFSPEPVDVAVALRTFAGAYQAARKYTVAEALYQRALAIQQSVAPEDRAAMTQTLRDLISLYRVEKNWPRRNRSCNRSSALR